VTDKEKLEIAVKALAEIKSIDGLGADMSPPGPCFDVADKALRQIAPYNRKRTNNEF